MERDSRYTNYSPSLMMGEEMYPDVIELKLKTSLSPDTH